MPLISPLIQYLILADVCTMFLLAESRQKATYHHLTNIYAYVRCYYILDLFLDVKRPFRFLELDCIRQKIDQNGLKQLKPALNWLVLTFRCDVR